MHIYKTSLRTYLPCLSLFLVELCQKRVLTKAAHFTAVLSLWVRAVGSLSGLMQLEHHLGIRTEEDKGEDMNVGVVYRELPGVGQRESVGHAGKKVSSSS